MADLVKKRQQRGGHKSAATKTLRKIEEAFKKDPIDKEALSVLKMTLSEKLDTIKALDAEILDLLDKDDEIATEIENSDDYKEEIYMVIGRISSAIRDPLPRIPTTGAATSAITAPAPSSHVRLPKLQLRSFSGDVTKWTSFWQSFEAAVHKNTDLSDVEKFNHLNSLLERSARDSVAGLALTEANYRQAIEILQKRFGSKQQIINKHMDALLRLESVTTSHSVRDLRRLFDDVSCQVRSLQTLGVESATYGSLLCPVLMNKIPQDLQLIISREVSEADWSIDKILELLEKELTARERIGARHGRPQHRHGERKPPSTPALITGQPSSSSCCYCNNSHLPEHCDTVTQIESRKQALRRSGQCFVCLRRGHMARDCRSSSRCQTCKGRHHSSICGKEPHSRSTPSSNPVATPPSSIPTTTHTTLNPSAPVYNPVNPPVTTPALCNSSNTIVLLQTATTKVSNPLDPSLSQNVRIVLDCGSQKSYLARRVSDKLQLPVNDRQKLSIAAFGSSKRSPKWLDIVPVSVHTKDGSNKEIELYVVPHICDPLTMQDVSQSKFAHLERLDLADVPQDSSLQVDLLIGSDLYWQFVTGETVRGTEGPVAVKTTLGWVLSGPTQPMDPTVSLIATHTLHVGNVSNRDLNDTLKLFWDLESMGIQPLSSDPVSDYFTNTVRMVDGRYEVSLPWQESHEPLPDNLALCRRRLHGLLQRLRRKPDILHEYNAIISDQLEKGIIEVVEDTVDTSEKIHYLPHHAVVRQDKATTKVRVVYDASSKSTGPSLNECLHAGPKFNQKILEILLRFRSYTVGLIADIEKAFLMISVSPSDRDSLRFLWTEDPYAEDLKIQKLRFARVVFGVSCSPFLLNATLQHHVEKYRTSHPQLVNILTESTYVDDVIFGADTEREAYELYRSSKEVMSHGKFNLRKFVTNAPSLQSSINVQENELNSASPLEVESAGVETIHPNRQQKVLGVTWDLLDDQLIFSLESFVETASLSIPTKRNIVSLVGQIYDPLGFLSPVTVRLKVLLQELCKLKIGWDQQLEGALLERWKKLVRELVPCPLLVLPRRYFVEGRPGADYRLYGFCDASTSAYAAVVYIVEEFDGLKSSSFVTAKTRVAPLKTLTIPRLELLSAVLLARLVTTVTESLCSRIELMEPRCYTDSQVAYYWIKGTGKDWRPFVQNRVNEIRKLLPHNCWDHCAGRENPADIPSRGVTPLELSQSSMWKGGPEWIQTASVSSTGIPERLPESCLVELKNVSPKMVHNLLTTQPSSNLGDIISIERFSTLQKLYRTTAYVLKFVKIVKRESISPKLTPADIAEAEILWISESQHVMAQDRKFKEWKGQFRLFQDDHKLWRCGGRLQNADIAFSIKHPLLLPKDHRLVTLIVQSAHQKVQHNGVKETLTEIRSKYWIVEGRRVVKSIVSRCVICRRFEGKPFTPPQSPPLPSFRVNEAPPFMFTAVDFAGPILIKDGDKNSSKVWIALFTCAVVRAVHLELVCDMSAITFIRCLRRFTGRRGLPKKFLSDNAKTFKAADKLIQATLSHNEVKEYLSHIKVEWSFNLEKAPWWGGLFERMVKSVKRCLKKVVGQAKFSYDELSTAVIEIEAIINSRPLTVLSSEDIEEPLTPSHLMVGRRLLSLPDSVDYNELDDEDYELTSKAVQRRVQHLRNILKHFWRRWNQEYLLELRNAHRIQGTGPTSTSAKPGDVVIIHDDDHPRGYWRLAVIEELIVGRDGLVRGAILRLPPKNGRRATLQRPLQRIYPLEVASVEVTNSTVDQTLEEHDEPQEDELPDERASRPQRQSAVRAQERFKQWSADALMDTT